MVKLIGASLPFLLAGCTAFMTARQQYHEGMAELKAYPEHALEHMEVAARLMAETLPDLEPPTNITAASIRLRALVELQRIHEADDLLATEFEGFKPGGRYEGDRVGLAMLRARALDPERGYAELLLAGRRTSSSRARHHLAREQVRLLIRIGTDKSRREALRICEENRGRLDFDRLKESLD